MNSRVLTSCDIGWIAEIMCRSTIVVSSRQRVCMGLGLSMSELTDIDIDRNKNEGTHGYLALALNRWIVKTSGATIEKLIEVLASQELNSTADEILRKQSEFPPNSCTADHKCPYIWFDVPEDVHLFTGRVDQMKELHDSIVGQHSKDGGNDMTVITAVSGFGGVGKTSLTIHYAWAFFKKDYTNVIWINSETKSTISNSFNRLARILGQNMSLEFCDVLKSIYESVGKAKTLVVFDNVECYEDVKSFLPIGSPKISIRPFVLLTSRKRNWHARTHLIDLDVFIPEESVEFFKSYSGLTTEEELKQAKVISEALQNLPLALRQAGAYIKVQHRENGKSKVEVLKSYMNLFESNSVEALNFNLSSYTTDIYEKTIFSTWTVNMEKLKQENRLTRTIVDLISYLNPDNIPIKLFYSIPQWLQGGFTNMILRRNVVEMTQVNAAVKLLADFSLIRRVGNEFISVHRLLQKVVRTQNHQKYKNSKLYWIIDLIGVPLRLNNYDHYEDICLLHSLSIKEHIPPHHLHTRRTKFFLKSIERKQNNSVSSNLTDLQKLLEQDKFGTALKLYDKCRKLYSAHGTSTRKPIDQIFTIRFLNLVCLQMVRDSNRSTRVPHLCQVLLNNVICGSNISFGSEETIEDLRILRETVVSLYRTVATISSSIEARKQISSIVYFVLGNLIYNTETSYIAYLVDTCSTMFDCLVQLQAIAEIENFLESFSILVERILSKQSDSELRAVVGFQNAIDEFFKKVNASDLPSADTKLFVPLSNLQCSIYSFYRSRNNFMLALLCGSNIIECKLKINDAFQFLETVRDIKSVLSKFLKSTAYKNVNGKMEDDIELVDKIHEVSKHPNCASVRNELIAMVYDMYNLILVGRRLTGFNKGWYRIASSMVECSVHYSSSVFI